MDYSEDSSQLFIQQEIDLYGKPAELLVAYAILGGHWDNYMDHHHFLTQVI